jgi:hypothetical protein
VLVYVAPDAAEQRDLTGPLGIDPYDLESALDPDEVPRQCARQAQIHSSVLPG